MFLKINCGYSLPSSNVLIRFLANIYTLSWSMSQTNNMSMQKSISEKCYLDWETKCIDCYEKKGKIWLAWELHRWNSRTFVSIGLVKLRSYDHFEIVKIIAIHFSTDRKESIYQESQKIAVPLTTPQMCYHTLTLVWSSLNRLLWTNGSRHILSFPVGQGNKIIQTTKITALYASYPIKLAEFK